MHNVIQTTESHKGHIVLCQIFIYILRKNNNNNNKKTLLWRSKDHDLQKYLPMKYLFLHFRYSWAKKSCQLQFSQLTYWSVNSFGTCTLNLNIIAGKTHSC